jgi:hypothetical protein
MRAKPYNKQRNKQSYTSVNPRGCFQQPCIPAILVTDGDVAHAYPAPVFISLVFRDIFPPAPEVFDYPVHLAADFGPVAVLNGSAKDFGCALENAVVAIVTYSIKLVDVGNIHRQCFQDV